MPDGALLVFHTGALGDLTATYSNLLALRKYWPKGIDGVCQDHLGRLGCDLGIFRRSFAGEAARFASLYASAASSFVRPVDASMKAFFRPYRAVILFSNSRIVEQNVSAVFSHPVLRIAPRPPQAAQLHIRDHVFQHLVAAKLLDAADKKRFVDGLWYTRTRRLQSRGIQRIFIHPGSGSPRKNWPASNFTTLAGRLHKRGMTPEFIVGPAEKDLVEKIEEDDGAWKIHTPATVDALRRLLEGGDGYVGNDSGVSHLAAFLGLPTLTLFGPSDPLRWRPRGPRSAVLTASGFQCAPCFERSRENCDRTPCLSGITVDAALERFCELLSGN